MRCIVIPLIGCLLFGICCPLPAVGSDTTVVTTDTLTAASVDSSIALQPKAAPQPKESRTTIENPFITPKKTALFSAILPGLGQAYNHQYWKIPVIYAGLGVAAYFIQDNLEKYNTFREIAAGRASGDPAAFQRYPEYSDEVIVRARDYYRKNLDLTVLITAVGYTLQILDAVVFAHLKTFDMSPDISFRAVPVIMPYNGLGVGVIVNF